MLCEELEELVYMNRLAKEMKIGEWVGDGEHREELMRMYRKKIEL